MSHYVFERPRTGALHILGTRDLFPVGRIFCVGQNYADHAREMGAKVAAETPIFFMKSGDLVAEDGAAIPYPPMTSNLHHEIELVAALSKGGADIPETKALSCVFGYAPGIDFTRRDLQTAAKETGRPWDMGKNFDHAAPMGTIAPAKDLPEDLSRSRIYLSVNGVLKQNAHLSDMIWSVPKLVSILSRHITLKPGDLIMTGTPAGVGPVKTGDKIDAGIENIGDLSVTIV